VVHKVLKIEDYNCIFIFRLDTLGQRLHRRLSPFNDQTKRPCSHSHQPLEQSTCHKPAVNSSHTAIIKRSTRHRAEQPIRSRFKSRSYRLLCLKVADFQEQKIQISHSRRYMSCPRCKLVKIKRLCMHNGYQVDKLTGSRQISWYEPEQRIDDYWLWRERLWEKGFNTWVEMPGEMSIVSPESVTMEKSWVMMMHQTDKEHEEYEEACSASQMQHEEKSGLWSWEWSELMIGGEWSRYRWSSGSRRL